MKFICCRKFKGNRRRCIKGNSRKFSFWITANISTPNYSFVSHSRNKIFYLLICHIIQFFEFFECFGRKLWFKPILETQRKVDECFLTCIIHIGESINRNLLYTLSGQDDHLLPYVSMC